MLNLSARIIESQGVVSTSRCEFRLCSFVHLYGHPFGPCFLLFTVGTTQSRTVAHHDFHCLLYTHRDAVAPSANEVVADQSLYAYAYHYAFAEERQNSP